MRVNEKGEVEIYICQDYGSADDVFDPDDADELADEIRNAAAEARNVREALANETAPAKVVTPRTVPDGWPSTEQVEKAAQLWLSDAQRFK